ncbi:MAG TPA: hypothetical protein VKB46_22445 [Pyrinomonadaceae bacterium]|nr:hypothetical protein [Pyrinomonadaceae bacterium]
MHLKRFLTKPIHYLLVAAAFHVLVALAVFLVGHFQLLPNTIDTHGVGISFAIDGLTYRSLAIDSADLLRQNGIGEWLSTPLPFHARLYSLLFALLGNLLGYNILTAEPLNVLLYVGILSLVYRIGRELFDSRAGFIAATLVALWPSFLLHSVQLIRDPLAILLLLVLLLGMIVVLMRPVTIRQGLALGVALALVVAMFWKVRGNMWTVAVVLVALTLVFFLVCQLLKRKVWVGNLLTLVLVTAVAAVVPSYVRSVTVPGLHEPTTAFARPGPEPEATHGLIPRLIKQISGHRSGNPRGYFTGGSNIDAEVRLDSGGDILRYLPRAAAIGFLAPFPNMWLHRNGVAGGAARLLSGVEMLVWYFLYVLVLICLWHERRQLALWLPAALATVSLIALGLVVINAGALYRLRYAFLIMLTVLAAKGMEIVATRFGWQHPASGGGTCL